MSVTARIVDKLRNYEYEKSGYEGAINDIYALIQHVADLEEETDGLRYALQEQEAWEGRYWALIEEAEASRPRQSDPTHYHPRAQQGGIMNELPTAPLIRITRGKVDGDKIADELAARRGTGDYLLLSAEHPGWTIARSCQDDSIDEWEEVTPVPTAALKKLQEDRGRELTLRDLRVAIDGVLEALPADKFTPLARVAARVKDAADFPTVDAETPIGERLSLLLETVVSVHGAPRKSATLIAVARICADWLCALNPGRVGLGDIEDSAREITIIPDSAEKRYLSLTHRLAHVANLVGEGGHGSAEIMGLGAYALAWAAKVVEEEES